eukprot:GHVP01031229.1.p1 GENE.GHVP01031229.1~~GHVP01031229.1.p1  ORF type:complete len:821 (+),score=141.70 GHVP01031229.1:682-3144(+)
MSTKQQYIITSRNENDFSEKFISESLKKTDKEKKKALGFIIVQMIAGKSELGDTFLMDIMQFVFPGQEDKLLKRMCYVFFTICSRTDRDGKVKEEVLLICNALRKDLTSPNEYIRAACLNFIATADEKELIGPLASSVFESLSYKNSHVRSAAARALGILYLKDRLLFNTAPICLKTQLYDEKSMVCIRSMLTSLFNICKKTCIEYIISRENMIMEYDSKTKVLIASLIRSNESTSKPIGILRKLLYSSEKAAVYESITSLMLLSKEQSDYKKIANRLFDLFITSEDNNNSVVVSKKMIDLQNICPGVFAEWLKDLMPFLFVTDKELSSNISIIIKHNLRKASANIFICYLKENKERWLENGVSDKIVELICTVSHIFPNVAILASSILTPLLKEHSSLVVKHLRSLSNISVSVKEDIYYTIKSIINSIDDSKTLKDIFSIIPNAQTDSVSAIDLVFSFTQDFSGLKGTNEEKTSLLNTILDCVMDIESKVENNEPLSAKIYLILVHICKTSSVTIPDRLVFEKASSSLNMLLSNTENHFSYKQMSIQPFCNHQRKITEKSERIEDLTSKIHFFDDISSAMVYKSQDKFKDSKIYKTYNLSGYSNSLFVEVKVSIKNQEIELDFLIVNQTDKCIEGVYLELILSENLKQYNKTTTDSLYPNSFISEKVILRMTSSETARIFPIICYGKGIETVQNLQHLIFPPSSFTSPNKMDKDVFRNTWQELAWEMVIEIPENEYSTITDFIIPFLSKMKFEIIENSPLESSFASLNISTITNNNASILGSLAISFENDILSGTIRLRGPEKKIVLSLSDEIISYLSK